MRSCGPLMTSVPRASSPKASIQRPGEGSGQPLLNSAWDIERAPMGQACRALSVTSSFRQTRTRLGSASASTSRPCRSASTPALQGLVGQSIQGNCVLQVTDLVGQNIGKLNAWTLELSYNGGDLRTGTGDSPNNRPPAPQRAEKRPRGRKSPRD